jgi:iron complex outermembrane receptor protein
MTIHTTLSTALAFLGVLIVTVAASLDAQAPVARGTVSITVVGERNQPLTDAVVTVISVNSGRQLAAGLTDSVGVAVFRDIPSERVELRARRIDYAVGSVQLLVAAGQTSSASLQLTPFAPSLSAIRVVALRGDGVQEQLVKREQIEAVVPHDAADVLRVLPGTDAMRRGAIGLDPVVRGLRDTQLGVYVDAARTFPGGPAGMDTPMSHVDPSHVQSMEVMTGPYALTWGAGNLSAIRVNTTPLPDATAGAMRSRFSLGYDGNLNAREASATITGAPGVFRYVASGTTRDGDDYTSGANIRIPGSFRSNEVRGRAGVATTRLGTFSLLGSIQAQRDIDYPGRPLDATFFDASQLQAEWMWRDANRVTTARSWWQPEQVEAMVYRYNVDHAMDNDNKPTALPDPTRVPAFPVLIVTESGVRVYGARAMARFTLPSLTALSVGADVYDADHDAFRRTDRRDTGAPVRTDLIWGGARIIDAGVFARIERTLGAVQLASTVRVDRVQASSDSVSTFFSSLYNGVTDRNETNWSGAVTARVPLGVRWAATFGVGSVARTAEANERFSDRAAAKRAQTNAEFVGNPLLRPERSTQGDLWLEGEVGRVSMQLNAFVRELDDYITIEVTSLPRRQVGSPPPVFRFINGRASYVGGEALARLSVTEAVTVSGSLALLRGTDHTLNEPALGVTPARGIVRARWAPAARPWFVEGSTVMTAGQSRVATTRGERATPGWSTVDVQAGYTLPLGGARSTQLRVGVRNLFDREFVEHLTALNAFGGGRIPEPGRVLFARVVFGL